MTEQENTNNTNTSAQNSVETSKPTTPSMPTLPKFKIKPSKKLLVVIVVLVLLGLAGFWVYKNKSVFIAAKVNNMYITREQLNKELVQRYGTATLDEIITISLAKAELSKNNVVVTDAEVDAKVKEIEANLNGVKLDDALKMQGVTRAAFLDQMKLQLGVEKYLSTKVTVTEEELKQYLTDNAALLTAKDEAGKRAEAQANLKQQKLSESVNQWITEIRATAKITKYL